MGQTTRLIERWKMEMPTEAEMLPKDKYTIFDRKEKKYRKGIHSKWKALYERLSMVSLIGYLQNYRSGRECRRGLILQGFNIISALLKVFLPTLGICSTRVIGGPGMALSEINCIYRRFGQIEIPYMKA